MIDKLIYGLRIRASTFFVFVKRKVFCFSVMHTNNFELKALYEISNNIVEKKKNKK